MSPHRLKVVFSNTVSEHPNNHYIYRVTPFKDSENIYTCPIEKSQKLTEGPDVKTVYHLSLDLKGVEREFFPGDTIGVLPSNDPAEIDKLLLRLNLQSVADNVCELQGTVKKHLPPESSLRNIFLNHVDVRSPPKKEFLRCLYDYTSDHLERARLADLSGCRSLDYLPFATTTGKSLLTVLDTFPSCHPPVEVLLERLPPLRPRPYSISSSPLSGKLEITFFVLEGGVCTPWLEAAPPIVPFYFRKPTNFRLDSFSGPLILVGAGTGIAPFRGYFQHLRLQGRTFPRIWLFYGCRYRDRDFLFRDEVAGVVVRMEVAFSRESPRKCYVQDKIRENENEVREWVLQESAAIFVCGGSYVVRDVREALVDILGLETVKEMESDKRIVADTWV